MQPFFNVQHLLGPTVLRAFAIMLHAVVSYLFFVSLSSKRSKTMLRQFAKCWPNNVARCRCCKCLHPTLYYIYTREVTLNSSEVESKSRFVAMRSISTSTSLWLPPWLSPNGETVSIRLGPGSSPSSTISSFSPRPW